MDPDDYGMIRTAYDMLDILVGGQAGPELTQVAKEAIVRALQRLEDALKKVYDNVEAEMERRTYDGFRIYHW